MADITTRSGSVTSSSFSVTSVGSTSPSSFPTFPSFTTPPPLNPPTDGPVASPTQTPNSGPNIASSASLYLYTFLATLVLLLGVSAAIVARSLILRRRHRAMVEEAIRNGTWIPPTNGFGTGSGRRGKIDPSKKPKMFDAYLGGGLVGAGAGETDKGKEYEPHDWEAITPFSASYITAPRTAIVPRSKANTAPAAPRPHATIRQRIANSFATIFSPSSAHPTSPLPDSASPSASNSHLPIAKDGQNATLRVAVLIAMPSKSTSAFSSHTNSSLSSPQPASSSLSHPLASSPSASSLEPSAFRNQPGASSQNPQEPEELPHVEFGIAELSIVAAPQPGENDDHESIQGKDSFTSDVEGGGGSGRGRRP